MEKTPTSSHKGCSDEFFNTVILLQAVILPRAPEKCNYFGSLFAPISPPFASKHKQLLMPLPGVAHKLHGTGVSEMPGSGSAGSSLSVRYLHIFISRHEPEVQRFTTGAAKQTSAIR